MAKSLLIRVQISEEYARILAEKAMELANMALVGVVLSQFVGNEPFRTNTALIGVLTFVVLHIAAFVLMRGGES